MRLSILLLFHDRFLKLASDYNFLRCESRRPVNSNHPHKQMERATNKIAPTEDTLVLEKSKQLKFSRLIKLNFLFAIFKLEFTL